MLLSYIYRVVRTLRELFSLKNFCPTFRFRRVTDITIDFLKAHNICAILLDKDETIIVTGEKELQPEIYAWMLALKGAGIKIVLLSNSMRYRSVAVTANACGVHYIVCGPAYLWGKPWTRCFWKGVKKLNATATETLVIGDQLMTDIWGGNCCGIKTVLVNPLSCRDRFITRITGGLVEKMILKKLGSKKLLPEYENVGT